MPVFSMIRLGCLPVTTTCGFLAALILSGTVQAQPTSFELEPTGESVLVSPVKTRQPAKPADEQLAFENVADAELMFVEGESAACCDSCGGDGCSFCDPCGPNFLYPNCTPPGVLQRLACMHAASGACWTGRVDAVLLLRNAPPSQPLFTPGTGGLAEFNANQLESDAAAGPRFSLFRTDRCGNAWEWTYLRAFNFRSQRTLPGTTGPYTIADPGIYGVTAATSTPFNDVDINLGSGIQTFELNHHRRIRENFMFLAGFRWLEWREQVTITAPVATPTDIFQNGVFNDLYGGQIGLDARLLSTAIFRLDSVIKAGAYFNHAAQTSTYTNSGTTTAISVGESPANCAFVGELGVTGVIPLASWLDFRFGYLAYWLESIAQPTEQLPLQNLTVTPPTGTLITNGGTVVQGLTLGLEGRW